MKTCTYRDIRNPKNSMSAKEFGYISARWAVENTTETTKFFQRPPLSTLPGLKVVAEGMLLKSAIMIALQGAAYWMFAAGVQNLTGRIGIEQFTETLKELKHGRDDLIDELKVSNGGKFVPDLINVTTFLFNRFFNDLLDDMRERQVQDPAVVNFDLSKAAVTFMEVLKKYFKTEIQVADQLVIATFIDEFSISTVDAMDQMMTVTK